MWGVKLGYSKVARVGVHSSLELHGFRGSVTRCERVERGQFKASGVRMFKLSGRLHRLKRPCVTTAALFL